MAAGAQYPPEGSSTEMAEGGAWPAREHRSHPTAFCAETGVPNGENTTMNAVEPSRPDSTSQALPANSRSIELGARDYSVLGGSNLRDEGIRVGVGTFLTHVRE